jgi:DnaK suppressor protein
LPRPRPDAIPPAADFLTGWNGWDKVKNLERMGAFALTYHPGASMNAAEIDQYREQLLALRQRLNGDVSHLTEEALRRSQGDGGDNLSNLPIHMADLGTDNFEREFTLSLVENEGKVLDEVTAALQRLDQGQFGRCEECQAAIPKARLGALPYTRHCVDCARKLEGQS